MNRWQRVLHFDRSVVKAGGYLYIGIVLLLIAVIVLGAWIVLSPTLFPAGEASP